MLTKHALETQVILGECRNVETGTRTHPASYSTGTRFFPGGKAVGGGGDVKYAAPSSADVKSDWRYTATPLHVFIASARITWPVYLYLLLGSLTLLTVVIVNQGVCWREKRLFNTSCSCKSRKLSRCVTSSQNCIPLELQNRDPSVPKKIVNIFNPLAPELFF